MPATAAEALALVAGARKPSEEQMDPQTKTVRVVRAFYYGGKLLPVGKTAELPVVFAAEMRAANKVEFTSSAPPPKTEPTKRSESKDAG